jgi:hypothetical protein
MDPSATVLNCSPGAMRRDGRPSDWSLNHLAGARDWANDLVERRRRFAGRPAIAPEQRLAFRLAVLANKERRCTELRRQAASGRCTRSICSPSITRVWCVNPESRNPAVSPTAI